MVYETSTAIWGMNERDVTRQVRDEYHNKDMKKQEYSQQKSSSAATTTCLLF